MFSGESHLYSRRELCHSRLAFLFRSIYVLIERATLEAKYGLLDWPFWTKMLVSHALRDYVTTIKLSL